MKPLVLLLITLLFCPTTARAEMPPWWYAKWQHDAEQVKIRVFASAQVYETTHLYDKVFRVEVKATVVEVYKSASGLKVSDQLTIRYRVHQQDGDKVVYGAARLSRLEKDHIYFAYLAKASSGYYVPAARGQSFVVDGTPSGSVLNQWQAQPAPPPALEPDIHFRVDEGAIQGSDTTVLFDLERYLGWCHSEELATGPMNLGPFQANVVVTPKGILRHVEWKAPSGQASKLATCVLRKVERFRKRSDGKVTMKAVVTFQYSEPGSEPTWAPEEHRSPTK